MFLTMGILACITHNMKYNTITQGGEGGRRGEGGGGRGGRGGGGEGRRGGEVERRGGWKFTLMTVVR